MYTLGEGCHNYHHTFPLDYKSAEFGDFGATTILIRLWEKMGLAYDLKEPSKELIIKTAIRRGDGSHPECKWNDEYDLKGE